MGFFHFLFWTTTLGLCVNMLSKYFQKHYLKFIHLNGFLLWITTWFHNGKMICNLFTTNSACISINLREQKDIVGTSQRHAPSFWFFSWKSQLNWPPWLPELFLATVPFPLYSKFHSYSPGTTVHRYPF